MSNGLRPWPSDREQDASEQNGADGVGLEHDGRRSLLAGVVLWFVKLYRTVSSGTRPHCRYLPTCSAYADEAVRTHGALQGGWMAVKRISRCHPWGGTGYDPVPGTDPDFESRHPGRRGGQSPSAITTKAAET